MKKILTVTLTIALVFALALATTACDDGNDNGKDDQKEEPHVPQPKTITQDDGLAFTGKVTIKTSDQYTAADWDAVVQKVIAALNRGYSVDGLNEFAFDDVFNSNISSRPEIEVIVLKSASYNVEVKNGEYGKLYLKESSLDTVDVKAAVWVMCDGLNGTVGKYQA